MPTYEYRCEACGHEFERFQPMTAASTRTCPVCHKRKVKRLLSTGAGLIFKGSGFYATDYRSASYKEGAKKDSPAPAASPCDGCKKDAKSCPAKKEK
jgi:putative FmdB family regulatory protein